LPERLPDVRPPEGKRKEITWPGCLKHLSGVTVSEAHLAGSVEYEGGVWQRIQNCSRLVIARLNGPGRRRGVWNVPSKAAIRPEGGYRQQYAYCREGISIGNAPENRSSDQCSGRRGKHIAGPVQLSGRRIALGVRCSHPDDFEPVSPANNIGG
jgi:hypothetical protein